MRPSKTINEKVEAEYPEFVQDVLGLDVDSLEKRLSTYAKHRDETEEAKKNDDELNTGKATVKEMSAPYNDALKAINLKSKYIVALIKEKGGQ